MTAYDCAAVSLNAILLEKHLFPPRETAEQAALKRWLAPSRGQLRNPGHQSPAESGCMR